MKYSSLISQEHGPTCDAVVHGSIVDVRGEEDIGGLAFSLYSLEIDEVLKGTLASSSVLLEEDASQPVSVGQTGFFFLHRKLDRPAYFRLINSQGALLTEGSKVVASNNERTWLQDIELLSPEQLRVRVIHAIEAGAVLASPQL
jgi:hypothetical protein